MTLQLSDTAERALALMRRQGFDQAQVGVALTTHSEITAAHNQASLLRSTETLKVALLGLIDGRKASTEVGDIDEASLADSIASLWDSAKAAPQDEANAVSSGQHARIVQGPPSAELASLADTLGELLAWRAANTPTMMLEEGLAGHTLRRSHTLTSGGSDLACDVGWYDLMVMGSATEGAASSSFNYAGGSSHDLRGMAPAELFGLGEMMQALTRQVHTQALSERFVGDVVLTPSATTELLGWLLDQVSDGALITDTSVYRERAGELIASPLLDLRSRFAAPGVVPLSGDAFNTPPLHLLRAGRLSLPDAQPLRQPPDRSAACAHRRRMGACGRQHAAGLADRGGAARCAGRPPVDGQPVGQWRLFRRHQEQLPDRSRRGRAGAVGGDDLGQRRADAEGRGGREPRAHRHRQHAAALAAHRRVALPWPRPAVGAGRRRSAAGAGRCPGPHRLVLDALCRTADRRLACCPADPGTADAAGRHGRRRWRAGQVTLIERKGFNWQLQRRPAGPGHWLVQLEAADDTEVFELARRADELRDELDLISRLGNIGLWRHDLGTDRVFFDERACRHLGLVYSVEGLPVQDARDLVHPDDLPALRASYDTTLQTGQPSDMSLRYRRHGGGWIHMLLRRMLQRDPQGRPVAFLGVLMDETDRVQKARREQELSHRLESAAEAARIGLWTARVDGSRPDWNRRMFDLFGLDPAAGRC
jgi:PmbA protein